MPTLGTIELKEVILPSFKDPADPAIVKIKTELTAGDVLSTDAEGKMVQPDTFDLLKNIIVDWNFKEVTGEMTPITIENIKKLKLQDIQAIQENIKMPESSLTDDKKKA